MKWQLNFKHKKKTIPKEIDTVNGVIRDSQVIF